MDHVRLGSAALMLALLASPAAAFAPIAAVVQGQVRDASTQAPLAGVDVTIGTRTCFFAGCSYSATVETTTGADGRYALEVPPRTYRILAGTPGRISTAYPDVRCYIPELRYCAVYEASDSLVVESDAAVLTGIDFELHEAGRISGTVRDAHSLAPIVGATVSLQDPVAGFGDRWTTTDANGDYQFDQVRDGNFTLSASDAGGPDRTRTNAIYPDTPCDDSIVSCSGVPLDQWLAVGEQRAGMDLHLSPGARVTVELRDAVSGKRIENEEARLHLAADSTRYLRRSDLIVEPGFYRLGPVVPGDFVIVFGGTPSYRYKTEVHDEVLCQPYECEYHRGTILSLSAGEHRRIVEELRPHRVVRGRILDSNGNPVPGLRVASGQIHSNGAHGSRAFNAHEDAVTGQDGRFVLSGLLVDQLIRTYTDGVHTEAAFSDIPCSVANHFCAALDSSDLPYGETDLGDLRLGLAGAITGTVYDPGTHAPAAGAYVHILHPSAHDVARSTRADALGRYRMSGLPDDSYLLVSEIVGGPSELHPWIACAWPGSESVPDCDITLAEPIQVTEGATVRSVNFFAGHVVFADDFE